VPARSRLLPLLPLLLAPPPPPSASPNAVPIRDRHITLGFTTRRSIALPAGCSTETIRTRMNAVFANAHKIGGSHPYLKEARLRADIGCIFMTLSAHTAAQVGGLLEKCHAVLMRDLLLPDFSFSPGVARVKVLVTGVPLADCGRGSLWKIEDWTNDRVYDGLRMDLENSNPGIVTVGRPNIIGSVAAMKASGAVSCAVKFVVERSPAMDTALRASRMCLRGGNRVIRLWTEHAQPKTCHNCMQLGHISTLCSFPPRCRLCRGNHATRSHLCQQLNCSGGAGEACEHTVRVCLLCESSGHFTGHPQCPSLRLTPDTAPPPLGGSPVAGAADSVNGVTDRSTNRENNKRRCRRRVTPVGEVALDAASAPAPRPSSPARLTKAQKGKGIAVYEAAALSSSSGSSSSARSGLARKCDDGGGCDFWDDTMFGEKSESLGLLRPGSAPPARPATAH